MPPKGGSAYTEEEITAALIALIAWAGNAAAAVRSLKADGKRAPAYQTLVDWSRGLHATRYQQLHEKYAEQLEGDLVAQFRYAARHAVEVQLLGLEKAKERLEAGKDQDPSRTAANAATVADKMAGKVLSYTGRPTSIREDRNVEEIIRSLVARKVLALPEAEGAAVGEEGS